MDQTLNLGPAAPQVSSHSSPLAPLPASVLLEQELDRKDRLCKKGNLVTGCRELDEYVLLGGFERGSVVGVSAEEDDVGMLIGLQTIANMLVSAQSLTARAMVITTLPVNVLLPKLRMALVSQLSVDLGDGLQNLQGRVQECLERISIARVFDIDGLWEVLGELEDVVGKADTEQPQPARGMDTAQKPDNAVPEEQATFQRRQKTEVLDSEDEGGLSSPEPSPHPEPQDTRPTPEDSPSRLPDMILITHTSTLLNALFTGRDRQAAHNTMLLLSSHLHYFTRSPSLGGPLIMLLNSTTSPAFAHHADDPSTGTAHDETRSAKLPEPTLRSIFNSPVPPQQPGQVGLPSRYQPGHIPNSTQRNKPSFGMVFAQMLDLHLLCTRVPRTRADVAAVAASPGAAARDVSYAWVVEVLLDEMGVYETHESGERSWGSRRSREQRWTAVDVDDEGRVVDAVMG